MSKKANYGSPEYNVLMKHINGNNIEREFNPLFDAFQIYKNSLSHSLSHKDLTIGTNDLRAAFGDAFHDLYLDPNYHNLINSGNQESASVYALLILDSEVKKIGVDRRNEIETINSEMSFLMDEAGQFMNK